MSRILTILILTTCLAFNSTAYSQEDEVVDEPFDVLDIGGSITHGEENLADVKITLYEGNKVVDESLTKKNGKFKFTLMSNEIYTLELTKKGYYTKRVSVNTKLPPEVDDTYKFMFDLSLDSKEEKKLDKYLVEYPAVLIEYSAKKDEFVFDKAYTTSYFDELEMSND